MAFLIFLLVASGVAYRATTPESRKRAVQIAVACARRVNDYGREELAPFRATLRAIAPIPVVTAAIAIVNTIVFFLVMRTGGAGDTATLVRWGASVGPRTTNGEWWRLFTAMFAHASTFAICVNTAALVQLGVIVERLEGRFAFASAYVGSGMFAMLASVSADPTGVHGGATGAVLALYGVFAVVALAGCWRRTATTIPAAALIRMAPLAIVFLFYTVIANPLGASAELIALGVGIIFGVIALPQLGERSRQQRVAVAAGAALAILVASAVPLRGVTDVRPELRRLLEVERTTTGSYETGEHRLGSRSITPSALAQLIDTDIVPVLQATDARFAALSRVPREDEQRVADARAFLRLRLESWQLRAQELRARVVTDPAANGESVPRSRAEARHRETLRLRGRAEAAERAAMEAFSRVAL